MAGRRDIFGTMPDGSPVERLVLAGSDGFEVAILAYGAAIQSILVPDVRGDLADIVLGHDDLFGYLGGRNFFGATIGRYANRIAGGRFALGGRAFTIAPNDGANALHGGVGGFDTRLFELEEVGDDHLVLSRLSPDGEEGFPGNLDIRIVYEVEGMALSVTMTATTDADTVVNLTNHSFFNLAGSGSALGHELSIEADAFLPVDAGGIPLGERAAVAGTPFDFTRPRTIGERIREGHEQIMAVRGYDHNWCLSGGRTGEPRAVARLRDPAGGRAMVLSTTEPGLQFYSGNFLDGGVLGKGGRACRQGDGVCLEPQAFPDSPNRPDFPGVTLKAGETYTHSMRFAFEIGNAA